ncbi:ComEC/Rec2 family competence protein [Nocardia brevicatena]|uniref:ComEC/Rec2 family competence protein n=1 Tax=Nocardia brevicatena TaxID=37327 RepID=UPI00031D9153|nr:ComEC/Rec2 family competence protein [Nocardia brevicatena]
MTPPATAPSPSDRAVEGTHPRSPGRISHVRAEDRSGDEVILDARLLPAAVCCWLATLLAIGAGWQAGVAVAVGAVVMAFGPWGLWWTAVTHRSERKRVVTLVLLGAVLSGAAFAAVGAWREYRVSEHPLRSVPATASVRVAVTVADDPKPVRTEVPGAERLWIVRANLREYRYGAERIRVGGAVVILATGKQWSALLPGQPIEFRARPSPPRRHDLTVAGLRPLGPPKTIGPLPWWQRLAASVRADLVDAAARALPPESAGLLPALVVGDTSALSDEVRDEFVASGLQHLCVVSGANFTIVLTVVLFLTRLLTFGPYLSAACAAAALVLFVVIARPDPSVLRAAAMGSVTLLALVTGRRKQALPALCAAVIALLAIWPGLAVQAGFALSVLATGALILLAPGWVDRLRDHGWWRLPAELVAVAAAAFVVTAPILVALTGRLGLVAVAANILAAPVVAPITVVGAVGAVTASIWMPFAELILHCAAPPLWWLLAVADRAAAIPGATVPVPGGAAGGLVTAGIVTVGIWALHSAGVRRLMTAAATGVAAVVIPLLVASHTLPR